MVTGDPGFVLRLARDGRWDDLVAQGDAVRVVRGRRFDLLTEALGPDRARAADWTYGGRCGTPGGTSRTSGPLQTRPP